MPEDTDQGGEINEPKTDRIGNDFHEGPNPNPGGEIDLEGSLIPPYEGRTKGESDEDSS
jgi:hypothetical protein